MYRHELASTYEKLSQHTGSTRELYSGPFGQDLLADLHELGTCFVANSSSTLDCQCYRRRCRPQRANIGVNFYSQWTELDSSHFFTPRQPRLPNF